MHKKSIEAAHKLNEDDEMDEEIDPDGSAPHVTREKPDKEELRSESIATLRAKALEHSAKMREAINSADEREKSPAEELFNSSSSFKRPPEAKGDTTGSNHAK